MIEEVESAGEVVIGLEGFELERAIIHPRLDLIYDAHRAYRGGRDAVLAEWGSEVWVGVVLQRRDDVGS